MECRDCEGAGVRLDPEDGSPDRPEIRCAPCEGTGQAKHDADCRRRHHDEGWWLCTCGLTDEQVDAARLATPVPGKQPSDA